MTDLEASSLRRMSSPTSTRSCSLRPLRSLVELDQRRPATTRLLARRAAARDRLQAACLALADEELECDADPDGDQARTEHIRATIQRAIAVAPARGSKS
jgi:hypothetical protein